MTEQALAELPLNELEKRRNELAKLANSDLPVSDYADRLLELVDEHGGKRC